MMRATIELPAETEREFVLSLNKEVMEHYRALLRRLGWPGNDRHGALRTLGVTCSRGDEGVSTICTHLAATAASMAPERVLLVDAHVARPTIAKAFGLPATVGFGDAVMAGSASACEIQNLFGTGLSVLCAGSADAEADQINDSHALAPVISALKAEFDLVIFDLPPVGPSGAALRLSELLDGVLLVAGTDSVSQREARSISDVLVERRVRLLGAVLNQRPPKAAPNRNWWTLSAR